VERVSRAHVAVLLEVYDKAIRELYELQDRRVLPLVARLERERCRALDQLRTLTSSRGSDVLHSSR
jgi:hypothetical protein